MLLFVGSAWGDNIITLNDGESLELGSQITSLDNLVTGTYVLYVNPATAVSKSILYQNSDGKVYRKYVNSIGNVSDVSTSNVFKITVDDNATTGSTKSVTIQCLDGNYISASTSSATVAEYISDVTNATENHTTNYTVYQYGSSNPVSFLFAISGNPNNQNAISLNFYESNDEIKSRLANGGWSQYALYPVSVTTQTQITVTYRVVDASSGNELTSKSGTAIVGVTPTVPSSISNDYIKFDLTKTDPATVTSETETITFTGEVNLPFTPSTDYNNATWYFAKLRSSKYLSYPTTLNTTQNFGKEGMWAFIGNNPYGSFQIINAAASGKYLNGTESHSNDTEPAFGDNSDLSNWTLVKNTNGNTSTKFSFKLAGTTNAYIQDYGNNNVLKFWNNDANTTDDGAGFQIEQVDIESLATTFESNVGLGWGYPKKTDNFTNAYNAFIENKTLDNYQTLYEAYENGELAGSDGFVNIYNLNYTTSTYSVGLENGNSTSTAYGQLQNLNDASQIWLVTSPSAGVVNLYNPNANRYLGNFKGGASVTLSETPVNWDIIWTNNTFKLHQHFNYAESNNVLQLETTNSPLYGLNAWSTNSDWAYSEVKSFNINVHAVGNYSYATICYPFAVTLSDGEGYTGTLSDDGNSLKLTSIGTEIPAGTPVVVVVNNATTSSITATINGTDTEASPLSSGLSGTYLPKTIAEDGELTLGVYDNTAGFYHWSGSIQNKAYLNSSAASKGFAFSFGGDDDPTGISEDLIREAVKELQGQRYNVQGQPVGADYKGIVIQGGKKYLQK